MICGGEDALKSGEQEVQTSHFRKTAFLLSQFEELMDVGAYFRFYVREFLALKV